MSDAERLAERLRELLANATQGKWETYGAGRYNICNDSEHVASTEHPDDAAFIVEAVNALPTLLARIAALEDALREIADMTQKKQLPLTSMVNEIATKALGKGSE